jgi:hypothetical protein
LEGGGEEDIETFDKAVLSLSPGQGRLNRVYGKTAWRKRKGIAKIRLSDGTEKVAELHWYEGHGKGRKEMKIKKYLG